MRPPQLPPTDLPVEEVIDEVRDALAGPGRAVLQAEPGAGKTTIVPLRLLDEPWLGPDRIVVLEPRRVAARAAARRMAALLGEDPGATVGWVTRDDRRVGPDTRIEVVTEGVLTNRLVRDPTLRGVGLVVFDEFHERSLPGDTGLALALDARRRHRLTARLLVMSATLDTEAVAALLGGDDDPAPVVQSVGRTHPVEIRWRPRTRRDPLGPAVVRATQEALRGPGDVLVFLPGVGEIRGAERELATAFGAAGPAVLPLHGSLPAADQDAALLPRSHRRIVLATDLAETSLTVEGITGVVDSGLARVPGHDPRTDMTALSTVAISRASADQRAGRAGRTGPGVAIRLWSKVEHGTRPPHLPPAITAVELSGLVLDLARAGITDPATVPFLDPPPADHWEAATTVLRRLGALDTEGEVTELGSRMADLPLHPRLARTVADGRRTWLACLLAALLEDRDVLRGRPADLPADLAVRLALLLDPDRHHPAADGRALRRARERARDLARRAGLDTVQAGGDEPPDPGEIGATLVKGFPERVARARPGVRGRFVLADGRSAKLSRKDDLIDARGLLALDLGGRPKDPTINRAVRLEAAVDHLVYGTPDLDATVADLARQWGVTASPGGRHDGRGTRNALLGLGGGAYLEVIGPDPDQPPPPGPRPFGLDDIDDPALLTWAARVPDIDVWVAWARARGIDPGDPSTMQRTTPTGKVLQWRLTAPPPEGDGVLPFLIEWPGVTPAADAAPGITLTALELRHPDPAMAGRLAEHAIPVDVAVGPRRIAATLLAPTGVVELG